MNSAGSTFRAAAAGFRLGYNLGCPEAALAWSTGCAWPIRGTWANFGWMTGSLILGMMMAGAVIKRFALLATAGAVACLAVACLIDRIGEEALKHAALKSTHFSTSYQAS